VKAVLKEYEDGGKDLWKKWVLSPEWKVEGVIDDESKGGDCDEVICTGWVNQEDSEQNEVDGMKKGVDSTVFDAVHVTIVCMSEIMGGYLTEDSVFRDRRRKQVDHKLPFQPVHSRALQLSKRIDRSGLVTE